MLGGVRLWVGVCGCGFGGGRGMGVGEDHSVVADDTQKKVCVGG